MNTTHSIQDNIPGVGKLTPLRIAWALLMMAGSLVAVYSFSQQFMHGFIVTNLRTIGSGGAAWGLYIAFDEVFIGISLAGITVSALIRLFALEDLKPLARMAELLTIVALILGGMVVISDLGRPIEGLLNLPMYASPTSPFFGTFTMVIGGTLFASIIYLFLVGRSDAAMMAARPGPAPLRIFYRLWASGFKGTQAEYARHHKTSFWLSLFILPLLVMAHSTLGFVFGIQVARPGWFSALQAPSFVVSSGVSGLGALIVIAAAVRSLLGLQNVVRVEAFRWLGNVLWVLVVVVLYFIIAEELTASYAAGQVEREFAHQMLTGSYRHLFFLEVGSFALAFLVLFLQFALKKTVIGWTVLAGLLVSVGAVLKRHLLVVPSQTHGMLMDWPHGHYTPSFVELGLVSGLVCFGALLYSLFIWIFPIVPGKQEQHEVSEDSGNGRLIAALGVLALGVIVAVFGFAVSSRVGTRHFMDPIYPLSPVIFICGLVMMFGSAAVYELIPSRRGPPEQAGNL